jgi:5-methylcytosine-specific restriction endonuclease McrA
MYCAEHRLRALERNVAYELQQKTKRGAPHQGVLNSRQRHRSLRDKYGESGITVWDRDGGACILCHIPYQQKAIHIHHINGDPSESTVENMVCLCFRCHRLIHLMMEHPNLHHVWAWFSQKNRQ